MKTTHHNADDHKAWWRREVEAVLLALPVGLLTGSAATFFLMTLDWAVKWHLAHPGSLWLLPVGGFGVAWLYLHWGKGAERGTNLIIDEIHEPGGGVPARLAPLVLLGTLVTHATGGSVGREGTAVQMGGGLAAGLCRWLRVPQRHRQVMLQCGVAAGFGAVFGTPWAGAVFALEVLVVGRLQWAALPPALAASLVGDATCRAWGTAHTHYAVDAAWMPQGEVVAWGLLLLQTLSAGVAFGWAGRTFAWLAHGMSDGLAKWRVPVLWRPVMGAVVVWCLVALIGSRDYLGLGVEPPPGGRVSIATAFEEGTVKPWDWAAKLLFTAVSVGSGMKGGEVTPLFFVGATLGHSLALVLNAPLGLFVALGFVAVFGGASKTPLACTVMGMELFGWSLGLPMAVACWVSALSSGSVGLYRAQRRQGSRS